MMSIKYGAIRSYTMPACFLGALLLPHAPSDIAGHPFRFHLKTQQLIMEPAWNMHLTRGSRTRRAKISGLNEHALHCCWQIGNAPGILLEWNDEYPSTANLRRDLLNFFAKFGKPSRSYCVQYWLRSIHFWRTNDITNITITYSEFNVFYKLTCLDSE